MRLKFLSYILVLFLLAAWFDVVYAAATPDPDDDVVAAETNTYIAAPRPRPLQKPSKSAETTTGSSIALCKVVSFGAPKRTAAPPVWCGPPLAYVFMSLQR
jgi:hypothetical protein